MQVHLIIQLLCAATQYREGVGRGGGGKESGRDEHNRFSVKLVKIYVSNASNNGLFLSRFIKFSRF